MRLYIYRERRHHRFYLALERDEFVWLDTSDFDSYDECQAKATDFDPIFAAIIMQLMRLVFPRSNPEFEWDIETEKA